MSELLTFLQTQEQQFRRARIPSLYSDFRLQRTANPDGYSANISAWETGLTHALQEGLIPGGKDVLSLRTGDPLLQALDTREWGKPLALAAVIEEAVLNGRMIPLESFLHSPASIYDRSWPVSPWWVLSWGLKKLGLRGDGTTKGKLQRGQYVLVSNIEEAARKVMSSLSTLQSQVDRVLPMKRFQEDVEGALQLKTKLTADDLKILLVHLSRDKRYLAYDEQTVKLKGNEKNGPELIDADRNIASLKLLIADLSAQLEALTLKISDFDQKSRLEVSRKNRTAAIASLRSKKLHESIYTRRVETLAQLEGTYTKIEEAADQVEAVKVMQASTKVLKGLNDQVSGVETVEEVLDRLRTEMTQVEDVGAAIAEAGQESSMVEEGAIDEELEALEKENQAEIDEKAAKETQDRLERLQSVASLEIKSLVSATGEKSDGTARANPPAEQVDPEGKKPLDEKESRQLPEEEPAEHVMQMEASAV
ncbi:hypothetical protein MMC30_007003 [Trapelia coarctata]|nr:hypothetical protein [Trapelia coarctata]